MTARRAGTRSSAPIATAASRMIPTSASAIPPTNANGDCGTAPRTASPEPAARAVNPVAGTHPGVLDGPAARGADIEATGSSRAATEAGYPAAATATATPSVTHARAPSAAAPTSRAGPRRTASITSPNAPPAPSSAPGNPQRAAGARITHRTSPGRAPVAVSRPRARMAHADEEQRADQEHGLQHGDRGGDHVEHEVGGVDRRGRMPAASEPETASLAPGVTARASITVGSVMMPVAIATRTTTSAARNGNRRTSRRPRRSATPPAAGVWSSSRTVTAGPPRPGAARARAACPSCRRPGRRAGTRCGPPRPRTAHRG